MQPEATRRNAFRGVTFDETHFGEATDVLSVSGVATKVPPSDSRSAYVAKGNAARVCS